MPNGWVQFINTELALCRRAISSIRPLLYSMAVHGYSKNKVFKSSTKQIVFHYFMYSTKINDQWPQ